MLRQMEGVIACVHEKSFSLVKPSQQHCMLDGFEFEYGADGCYLSRRKSLVKKHVTCFADNNEQYMLDTSASHLCI